MRKLLIAASLAALTVMPVAATAQPSCEQAKHDKRVAGTVMGAVGGAVLGGLLGGNRGHKEDGALLGAAGGAVVGNQMSKGGPPCPDGQVPHDPNAYYDGDNNYHTAWADQQGYWHRGWYDRSGAWHADYAMDTRSGWHDDQGRWCSLTDSSYTDQYGTVVQRQSVVCR
jgi:hypothetical protein